MRKNERNWKVLLLSVLSILLLFGCATAKKSGKFEGVGKWEARAEIKVAVTITDAKITNIEVVQQDENKGLSDPVYNELKETIIAQNSADVDVVSGASATSEGYLEAVKDAIKKSGITLVAAKQATTNKNELPAEQTFDVVIVGSGGAGLSAAIEAAEAGKSVAIVEKNANSRREHSYFWWGNECTWKLGTKESWNYWRLCRSVL